MTKQSYRDAVCGLLLLVVLISCKGEKPKVVDTTTPPPAPPTSLAPTPAPPPPETSDELIQMNPEKWKDHIKNVQYDNTLAKTVTHHLCVNAATDDDCPLRFTPVKNAHLFKAKVAAHNNKATVLGLIENIGEVQDSVYHIKKHQRVLWVVSGTKSYLLDLDHSFYTIGRYNFTICHEDPGEPAKQSAAGFYYCANSPHRNPDGTYPSPLPDPPHTKDPENTKGWTIAQLQKARTSHTSPAWVSCAEGCCNVDGT